MSEPTKCLRCQGNLQKGYVLDASWNAFFPSSWVEGVPEFISGGWLILTSRWFGKPLDQRRLMSKSRLSIVSYRCTTCGVLESYAPST